MSMSQHSDEFVSYTHLIDTTAVMLAESVTKASFDLMAKMFQLPSGDVPPDMALEISQVEDHLASLLTFFVQANDGKEKSNDKENS